MYKNISQNPKSIVLSFIRDINAKDYTNARKYVSDSLQFYSVTGKRKGANAYFTDIKTLQPEYDLKNIFCEGDCVCLIYNFHISGLIILGCGLYHVTNNKIDSLNIIYDPRPLLALSASV